MPDVPAFGCPVKVIDVVADRAVDASIPFEMRPVVAEAISLAIIEEDTAETQGLPLARFAKILLTANHATALGRLPLGSDFYLAFQSCPPDEPPAENSADTSEDQAGKPATKPATKS